MKRLFFLSLILIAAPAWSESWELYAKTEEAVLYFDEHRRVVMSGTAFIWDLHDFRNIAIDAAGQSYRSILYATEYNCRKETRRVLSAQRMQDSYGKGAIVSENMQVGEWEQIVPHSPAAKLMIAACQE